MKTFWQFMGCMAIVFVSVIVTYPIWAPPRENPRRSSALSNMKQVATGVLIYGSDHEDSFPIYVTGNGTTKLSSWYNDVQPYIKHKFIFRPRASEQYRAGKRDPVETRECDLIMGLGMNSNLAEIQSGSGIAQNGLTVMLFETQEYTSYLDTSGQEKGINGVVSASGNGLGGGLFDSPDGVSKTGKVKYLSSSDYSGTHVFVKADSSAQLVRTPRVGIGGSYSVTGCKDLVTGAPIPCAPSVEGGRQPDRPTFSIR